MSAKQTELTNYFNLQKQITNTVYKTNKSQTFAEQFYNSCINQKETSKCKNESCIAKKNELESRIAELNGKCAKAEEAIKLCSMVIQTKNDEIANLTKLSNKETQFSANIPCNSTNAQMENNQIEKQPSLTTTPKSLENHSHDNLPTLAITSCNSQSETNIYDNFSHSFTQRQLSVLRSISNSIRDDSAFIREAVKDLYEDKIDCLEQKSLTGRGKNNKSCMTPEKVAILSNLFTERMSNMKLCDSERGVRTKKFNTLIKDAIHNINKSNGMKKSEKNVCQSIEMSLK